MVVYSTANLANELKVVKIKAEDMVDIGISLVAPRSGSSSFVREKLPGILIGFDILGDTAGYIR